MLVARPPATWTENAWCDTEEAMAKIHSSGQTSNGEGGLLDSSSAHVEKLADRMKR